MANSVDPDKTAPIGAVCSGSTLFAFILNLSVMLSNYLQQTTSAGDIFRCIFFLGASRVNFTCLVISHALCRLLTFAKQSTFSNFSKMKTIRASPGRVAQSVTCLATDACLTADPGVASSIPARYHTFVEIDHEI